MVKVSVIIPVYNAELYLEECLDSVCSQTLKEIEIICVDDGSTDDSLQILKRYAAADSRIKVLSQPNLFAGVARNNGMAHAAGRYLSFLDADDYFDTDMLEQMYNAAEKRNADAVVCRYAVRDAETDRIDVPDWEFIDSFFTNKADFRGDSLKHAAIFQITRGWAWDKLFRTDFVRQCGYEFPDFCSSEDGYFVYMLMARAEHITYMDHIFVTHRLNIHSSLSNSRESNWENGFKMLFMIMDEMKRLGIYNTYEQSFKNEAVNFFVWYLDTLHLFDVYKKCFLYMRQSLEPRIEMMKEDKSYYFMEEQFDWYRQVMTLSLEEYLFRRQERNLDLRGVIKKQNEIIRRRSWVFPFRMIEKGKTVVLYGAGKVGKAFYDQLTASQFCQRLIWVDRQYRKYAAEGGDVENPEVLFEVQYDYIFLALRDKGMQEEVKAWMLRRGVCEEKIKWFCEEGN